MEIKISKMFWDFMFKELSLKFKWRGGVVVLLDMAMVFYEQDTLFTPTSPRGRECSWREIYSIHLT